MFARVLLCLVIISFVPSLSFAARDMEEVATSSTGDVALQEVKKLKKELAQAQRSITSLKKMNRTLTAKVAQLKRDSADIKIALREPTVSRFYSKLRALLAKRDVAFRRHIQNQKRPKGSQKKVTKKVTRTIRK